MIKKRASGIFTHITSLPSEYGIGDIGPCAYYFVDFLVESEQSYWQFLPTGPTDDHFGHSPYMSTSAFAGSPLLISPELLYQQNLITSTERDEHPTFSPYTTDFPKVWRYKKSLLEKSFTRFETSDFPDYQSFLETNSWVKDYALFMVAKEEFGHAGWFSWPRDLACRDQSYLKDFESSHQERVNYYIFEQFIFSTQWQLLKKYCQQKKLKLFGDLPIYVSYDSVDVWANQQIFLLDQRSLKPTKVSGVPPDYFSETGQRWGNPLYFWNSKDSSIKQSLFSWWVERFKHLFSLVDTVRIDHFRGFESYWAIPAENETAVEGVWEKGPGITFFKALFAELGPLDIIAEDLGIITKEVELLRDELDFPGMKVLQFAFDGNLQNPFLPQNFTSDRCVVYTGTHDNDTSVGWYLSNRLSDEIRATVKTYANREIHDGHGIHKDLIYLAQASIAKLCIFPLQDVLGFGNDCRMNTPGIPDGNWLWRCDERFLTDEIRNYLKKTTVQFNRGRIDTHSNSLIEK